MDTIGEKIKEDIERKKEEEKNKGISIQVWKGKGKGGHVGGRDRGESTEVVHHHHYHGSSEEAPRPHPTQPPKKINYYEDTYDPVKKFAGDVHTGFMGFLDQAASAFRVAAEDEGYSRESSGYGHGGKGKGFQFGLWKDGRRR